MPYKSQNGFTVREMDALRKKYSRIDGSSGFDNFDSFLKFCHEQNYKQGQVLKRRTFTQPHGPDNSFFVSYNSTEMRKKVDPKEIKPDMMNPCVGCSNQCDAGTVGCPMGAMGCKEWRVWFQKHWDEFIHQDLKSETEKKGREFFRYEHPDLQREGIVWMP